MRKLKVQDYVGSGVGAESDDPGLPVVRRGAPGSIWEAKSTGCAPRWQKALRDGRCHKSEEEIAEQLSGHWREDHLFSLTQALKMYDSIQERMGEYEREILRSPAGMEREQNRGREAPKLSNKNKGRKILAQGEEPMRDHWRSTKVSLIQDKLTIPATDRVNCTGSVEWTWRQSTLSAWKRFRWS